MGILKQHDMFIVVYLPKPAKPDTHWKKDIQQKTIKNTSTSKSSTPQIPICSVKSILSKAKPIFSDKKIHHINSRARLQKKQIKNKTTSQKIPPQKTPDFLWGVGAFNMFNIWNPNHLDSLTQLPQKDRSAAFLSRWDFLTRAFGGARSGGAIGSCDAHFGLKRHETNGKRTGPQWWIIHLIFALEPWKNATFNNIYLYLLDDFLGQCEEIYHTFWAYDYESLTWMFSAILGMIPLLFTTFWTEYMPWAYNLPKCSPSLEKKTGGWKILIFAFKKKTPWNSLTASFTRWNLAKLATPPKGEESSISTPTIKCEDCC